MDDLELETLANGYVNAMLTRLQREHKVLITPGRYNQLVTTVKAILADTAQLDTPSR